MPDFLPDAAEAGTHNVPGIAGLLEGIRYLQSRGLAAVAAHEGRLIGRLARALSGYPNLTVYRGPAAAQSGVLSVSAAGLDCETVARRLGEAGVATRAGLHCAPVAHESAGTLRSGTVRLSVSDFTTEAEIDAVAGILGQICQL